MDYFETAEKIFKYFDINISRGSLEVLFNIKKKLNFEKPLFASLIKDYLLIKNKFKDLSDDLFSDFLLYIDGKDHIEFLRELDKFARFYRMIVFEKYSDIGDDKAALCAISTVNSCYKIELYPILLAILYMYYNQKINSQVYNKMLQSLVDTTIESFANQEEVQSLTQLSQTIILDNIKQPIRYAG